MNAANNTPKIFNIGTFEGKSGKSEALCSIAYEIPEHTAKPAKEIKKKYYIQIFESYFILFCLRKEAENCWIRSLEADDAI